MHEFEKIFKVINLWVALGGKEKESQSLRVTYSFIL